MSDRGGRTRTPAGRSRGIGARGPRAGASRKAARGTVRIGTSRASAASLGGDPFDHPSTAALITRGLEEDLGRGDVTTALLVPATARDTGVFVAREDLVVAGLPLLARVYEALGAGQVEVEVLLPEGARALAGSVLARATGPLRLLLSGERLALNLVATLSGTATLTARYVEAVAGTKAAIVDTRKTLPGMRLLQKWAVRAGGGSNHRFGLDDGILIKDNHVVAVGSVAAAVARARAGAHHLLRIEVECDRPGQVDEALAAGADAILLDNMTPADVRRCVERIGRRARVEVSGGIALETVRAFAKAGADLISVGRLTHSAPGVDIGFDLERT